MYLLFKAQHDVNMGIVQTVGRILDYAVGFVPDTHKDVAKIEHLNATILEDNVALAWVFFGAWKDTISIKAGTPQDKQFDNICSSGEEQSIKVKYVLTDEDNENAVAFHKALLNMILDEVYDKRFIQTNSVVSALEYNSWVNQEKEARAYLADNTTSVPMLDSLAETRGISTAEMCQKVINAIDAHTQKISDLLTRKQSVKERIKACKTRIDILVLMHNYFGIEANTTIDGIDGEPTENL